MFPLQQSKKFKNIYFAYEVSPEYISNVEIVYEEFREYDNKDILILRSEDHMFPDRYGVLFDSFGVLTYDKDHTSLVAAYSMFQTVKRERKNFKFKSNIYAHSFGFEIAILKSIGEIPSKYISTFEDIPGLDKLGKINPTEEQIKYIQKFCREIVKNAKQLSYDFYMDTHINKLIRFMPSCSIDILFGEHMELKFTDQFNSFDENYPYMMSKLLSQIPRVYTQYAIMGEPLDNINFVLIDRYKHCLPIHLMKYKNEIFVSCSDEYVNPKYEKFEIK